MVLLGQEEEEDFQKSFDSKPLTADTLTVFYVGLNLFLHSFPGIVLPERIKRSLDALMSGNRCVMKVRDKRLALFISLISSVD